MVLTTVGLRTVEMCAPVPPVLQGPPISRGVGLPAHSLNGPPVTGTPSLPQMYPKLLSRAAKPLVVAVRGAVVGGAVVGCRLSVVDRDPS